MSLAKKKEEPNKYKKCHHQRLAFIQIVSPQNVRLAPLHFTTLQKHHHKNQASLG